MKFLRFLAAAVLASNITYAATNELPILSDANSSIVSLDKEHQLGQAWARSLRGSAPLLDDPITVSYLNDLLWELVGHSQLEDKRLELIVLNNGNINAFAVPGGIIGINGGLILAAEQEDELASVIAHELAHLSQRHFAAQLEESRRNRPFALASLLASILVAAADSQAGMAAITSSIAAQQANALAFSRQNEQEADRVGMQTLVSAGVDPSAMPRMFSRLQTSLRFHARPPEFLLTHPVSESRIADSLNRAAQLPKVKPSKRNFDFELIKLRMAVNFTANPQTALNHYQTAVKSTPTPANQYGLALAAIRMNQFDLAEATLKKLPKAWQQHLYVRLTQAELYITAQAWQQALQTLNQTAQLYPHHYAVDKLRAKALMGAEQPREAIEVLNSLKQDYPTDTQVWYLLSEALGQAGKRHAVHQARIEYFLLTGQVDRALQQIQFARREASLNEVDAAHLDQLEIDAKQVREDMKMDF